MDVLAYSNIPDHAVETLQGLNQYRIASPQFCDFLLIVNGKNFYCHRSVLCLHSEYFRAMIGGMFSEQRKNQVVINEASLLSMESIMDYIYSGTLNINQNSVESLLKCAIRFQIQKVIDLCVNYLRHQIDETNSLEIYQFGRGLSIPQLEDAAKRFTYERLDAVFDVADVVKDMTRQDVESILQDELAHGQGEERRVMSILKWINVDQTERLKEMEYFVRTINWSKLSARFVLQTVLDFPLLTSNSATKKLIVEQVKKALETPQPSQENPESISPRYPAVRIRDRDRPLGGGKRSLGEEILLLVGGLTLGEAERDDFSQPNVMCYFPKTRKWQTRSNWPERRLRGFSVSRFYNDIIVSGGCDHVEMKRFNMKRCWKYDNRKDSWLRLSDMTYPRSFHSSCQVKGELFVIGGAFNDKIDMEVYSSYSNSWCPVKECAPRFVRSFTAAQCNGKIILMGSAVNCSSITMQCYNPAVASWTYFRSPNIPRQLSAPLCCTSQDESCIYLVGDNTQKVFVFNPNTNEWSRAEDMNSLHSNGGLTTIGKNIFMTGGHWEEGSYLDQMEAYNSEQKMWIPLGPLPHLWLYHTFTTILQENVTAEEMSCCGTSGFLTD